MNKAILVGNLVADPTVRYTNNQTCVAEYRLAVKRNFKNENGDYDSDFITCVAWSKAGEFAEKYFRKGSKIAVSGRIQTGSYKDRDGKTVYTTNIVVEEHEFAESKKSSEENKPVEDVKQESFMNIPDNIGDDLPFN